MDFGLKIKHIRKELGYTQESLAKIMDVKQPYISKYENNEIKPDIEFIIKLCKIAKISVNEFLELPNSNILISKEIKSMIHKVNSLNEEQRKHLISFLNSL